ncbi:hypothetical protein DFP73DRAFT_601986 [Morchella snyderi]|nr:hypothetical protein DFP73DRAFT_601986 [Morchella snyderi]
MALNHALGEIFQSIRECSQQGELIKYANALKLAKHWPSACLQCEVRFHNLRGSRRSSIRNYEDYRDRIQLSGENRGNLEPVEYLVARSVKTLFNAFWGMPKVYPYDLNKPDILQLISLWILKHMMDWIHGFLKKHY